MKRLLYIIFLLLFSVQLFIPLNLDARARGSAGIMEKNKDEGTKMENRTDKLVPREEAVLIDQLITQKLQEQRSLETLLLQKFSDHQKSFDSHLYTYVIIFTILVSLLSFLGWSEVKKIVRSQVGTQLVTPEVEKTVKAALEAKTADFVIGKIDPLKKSIDNMRNDLASLTTTAELIDPKIKIAEAKVKTIDDKLRVTDSEVIKTQKSLKDLDALSIYIQTVLAAANDDRNAFDQLLKIAAGNVPELVNANYRKSAKETTDKIVAKKQVTVKPRMKFYTYNLRPDEIKKLMSSKNFRDRQIALDYSPDDKSILPFLVEIIKSDDSIENLYQAVTKFNSLTKQSFDIRKTGELLHWWEKNRDTPGT